MPPMYAVSWSFDRADRTKPVSRLTGSGLSAHTISTVRISTFATAGLIMLLAGCGGTATHSATPAGTTSPIAAGSTPASCPNGRLANGDCTGGNSAVSKLTNDPIAPIVCPRILAVDDTDVIYNDFDQMQAIGEQAETALPDNPYDRNAVAVYDATGAHLAAYVTKSKARMLAKLLASGLDLQAVSLRGTGAGKACDQVAVLAASPAIVAELLAERPSSLPAAAHLRRG